jgi:hypothetical protein
VFGIVVVGGANSAHDSGVIDSNERAGPPEGAESTHGAPRQSSDRRLGRQRSVRTTRDYGPYRLEFYATPDAVVCVVADVKASA